MTKVSIISGFLGAGKTTFIKHLLSKVFAGQKVVLIENEFGEIGIDGGFLKNAGIEITEMNSGCICCTLVGDFSEALQKVIREYHPDRVLIEPSGVGKLSDVAAAVLDVHGEEPIELDGMITVVDAKKTKSYMKNFGEFFLNQVEHADTIVLSRTDAIKEEKLEESVHMLREHNEKAAIITTPWDELSGEVIQRALGETHRSENFVEETLREHREHEAEHHHDHEEHEHHHDHEEHEHHHDHEEHEHHHDHEEHEHHHDHEEHEHHHDHEEHEHHHDHEEHEHHHDHDHGENCTCGCHDHNHEGHHHHHHADEIFTSWGAETVHKYDRAEINTILKAFAETNTYGTILRSKGIVALTDGSWIEFDLVPEETEVRETAADFTGRICVIGTDLKEDEIKKAFHI